MDIPASKGCVPFACKGIPHLFYSPIHPPNMLEYWIRSSLWHCCRWSRGLPMGLGWVSWQIWLQSLGLSSCSELERSISLSASTPSFSILVYFLRLSSFQKLSQPTIQETGLVHQLLDLGPVCSWDVPETPGSFPNLDPLCVNSSRQFCHGLEVNQHNSSVPEFWNKAYDSWSGSPGWGYVHLAQWPLPLVPGSTSALALTRILCSSTFSPPWGSSQRSHNGMYYSLVSVGGLRIPLLTYMLLQAFCDLDCDMLCGIRSKSSLANRGEPLVDTLYKAQDELLVRGTSQLL